MRHRIVRVISQYGMFDRRATPQFYPELARKTDPTQDAGLPAECLDKPGA